MLLGVLIRSRAQATAPAEISPARAAAVTTGSPASAATTVTVSSRGGCGFELSRKR